MHKTLYILILCLMMASLSCKRLLNPFATNDVVVASVGERELYSKDIQDIFSENLTRKDSIALLESYVTMWVRNQLKLERAELMFSESQNDIDKMVEEYRNSLLNYKLDQFYIEKNINSDITPSDIEEYYAKNSKEFRLDRIIVKGRVIKVPESYRQLEKLQELMSSPNKEKQQDFIDICVKNDFKLTVWDDWANFNELLEHLPLRKGDSNVTLLKSSSVQSMTYDNTRYLFNIYESKKKGDIAPIELSKERIRKIILNERRVDVIRKYEDSLYTSAKLGNRIIINIEKEQIFNESTDSLKNSNTSKPQVP